MLNINTSKLVIKEVIHITRDVRNSEIPCRTGVMNHEPRNGGLSPWEINGL